MGCVPDPSQMAPSTAPATREFRAARVYRVYWEDQSVPQQEVVISPGKDVRCRWLRNKLPARNKVYNTLSKLRVFENSYQMHLLRNTSLSFILGQVSFSNPALYSFTQHHTNFCAFHICTGPKCLFRYQKPYRLIYGNGSKFRPSWKQIVYTWNEFSGFVRVYNKSNESL